MASLTRRKEDLHISVSDKGGEFVVSSTKTHKDITVNHLKSNSGTYRWIQPTRKQNNVEILVKRPTETTYRNQMKAVCCKIENKCNIFITSFCKKYCSDSKLQLLLSLNHTVLPTLYVLIKAHKLDPGVYIFTVPIEELKVHPIVSCTNSPTEGIAWLVTNILKPLPMHVPSHLVNTHSHLEMLTRLPPDELRGLSFFSADISALYTNLDIDGCINAVMEMAEEHWEDLNRMDLTFWKTLTRLFIVDFVHASLLKSRSVLERCIEKE